MAQTTLKPERRVYISADKDSLTGGIQLAISEEYPDGGGTGFRLCGPKYSGNSAPLKKHYLTASDARTIYEYIKPLLAEQAAA